MSRQAHSRGTYSLLECGTQLLHLRHVVHVVHVVHIVPTLRACHLDFGSLRPASVLFVPLLSPRLRLAVSRPSRHVLVSFRPGSASFRCLRLGFACSVSLRLLPVSARSRLESLQVQHLVGWTLLGLDGGEFGNFTFLIACVGPIPATSVARRLSRTVPSTRFRLLSSC